MMYEYILYTHGFNHLLRPWFSMFPLLLDELVCDIFT